MNLTVIKWRDIPTQVMIKKSRREVEKIQLNNRFMEAVDSAASVADATDADANDANYENEETKYDDDGPITYNGKLVLLSCFNRKINHLL